MCCCGDPLHRAAAHTAGPGRSSRVTRGMPLRLLLNVKRHPFGCLFAGGDKGTRTPTSNVFRDEAFSQTQINRALSPNIRSCIFQVTIKKWVILWVIDSRRSSLFRTSAKFAPANLSAGGESSYQSVRLILRDRIERAVRREAHHHRIYHTQRRSIPCHGAGEERGHQQDDQRHNVAEDPRRDAVNEALPRGA